MASPGVLLVDDEAAARGLLAGYLRAKGCTVTEAGSGEEGLEKYRQAFQPVAVIDMRMPGMGGLELLLKLRELNPYIQTIVLTAYGSVETAVEAMRAGAHDFITKPVEQLDEMLLKIQHAASLNLLIREHAYFDARLAEAYPSTELTGESSAMKKVREVIAKVGPSEATVLITGGSGTGKELVARALHACSARAERKMVAINCAAFPETLLESELFGYERGAFTGADKAKPGRFELAQGGTLFLDEVAEMPLTMQVKLLRVLEEKMLERLGSTSSIKLDCRLIAATNRELGRLVAEGKFREDLFYRLNVVSIALPSLKERKSDILLLAEKFLGKFARQSGRDISGFSPKAAELLTRYDWPGNVRELENVIERAVVLSRGDVIKDEDLGGIVPRKSDNADSVDLDYLTLAEIEAKHIRRTLELLDWNQGKTAEKLGIHRNTLRQKIKEYGIQENG